MIHRTASRWQTSDWQNILKNLIRNVDELCNVAQIQVDEIEKRYQAHKDFPVRVPRPFAEQIEKGQLNDPLLLQVLPQAQETIESASFSHDPLEEAEFNKAPGLIHKYQGRVLLIASPACAINCRYCFRRHFPYQENTQGLSQWRQALDYIQQDTSIQEVILSGGDPLSAKDDYLAHLIESIAAIEHVKWLRIHTRLPVVIPQRITDDLLHALTSTRLKTSMVLHINHANEVSEDLIHSIHALQAYGIRLMNQSVVLKGVNDTLTSHKALLEALHQHNIQAYYLHLLDKVQGAQHFYISDAEALALYEALRRELPGFMLPKLVREKPHAPYKTGIYE